MGLGKTAVVLHAILNMPKPVLLIAPIRVIETVWRKEAKLWPMTKGLTFSLLRGSKTDREQLAKVKADIYLVNPELAGEALEARDDYKVLIIDESSMYKNPSTVRFKTIKKHLSRFKHRIILTGTPTPNSLMELWSQIYILDMGYRLGKAFYRFQNRYFFTVDRYGYKMVPHSWAKEEILREISSLIFQPTEVLPPRTTIQNIVYCPIPPKVMKNYRDLERTAFALINQTDVLTAANAAAVMMKLRQVASGFAYKADGSSIALHDEKIKAVESILDETGSPVILVYQFRHELAALKRAFPQGVEYDSKYTDKWNEGKIPLLFLHPQSGGHGINLQYGGHTMIIYSASFSLEQMTQVMARINRQGQKFPVVFHFLVAPNTVDELLMEVLNQKRDDQTQVLQMIKDYANRSKK
jgi:SNF2 family DNA or RNA helicase